MSLFDVPLHTCHANPAHTVDLILLILLPFISLLNIFVFLFRSDLRSLIGDDEFSDVTFVVGERRIGAHRAILAARCAHFRRMLSSGMRESREEEIVIPVIRAVVFESLLAFLYTDELDRDVDPTLAVELHAAADLYGIERLQELCKHVVERSLDDENAAALHSAAHAAASEVLCAMSKRYIVRHFDEVSRSESFMGLPKELIIDIIRSR